jgi:hypothetical protein
MGDDPYMFPFMHIVQAIYIMMSFIKTQESEKRDMFWIAFFAFVGVNCLTLPFSRVNALRQRCLVLLC